MKIHAILKDNKGFQRGMSLKHFTQEIKIPIRKPLSVYPCVVDPVAEMGMPTHNCSRFIFREWLVRNKKESVALYVEE